jgi:signal recognition particle subunit SRP54
MFDKLTDRFHEVFRTLTGRGTLTESNVEEAMREVRRALLEADVNFKVVKEFVDQVRAECLGEKVLKSVTPGQQAVKVVYDHLKELLGGDNAPLDLSGSPAVVMLIGLHGSGKTTTAAKLAHWLTAKEKKTVMLAACDLRRPAAIDQLETLGREIRIPVFAKRGTTDVVAVAREARAEASRQGAQVLILDTAGRLQIDDDLVQELVRVRDAMQPKEILLVADAALGQQAVSVAEHFNSALGISGLILTKLDGDARGGAAMSMRHVTGRPVKFTGVGERIPDLEAFHPERMASRILGMGDVVSLVEKAAEHFDEEEAKKMEEKMRKNTFDLNDFRDQLRKLKKMGGVMAMLDMLPGTAKFKDSLNVDDGQLKRVEAVICGMTPGERAKPEVINASRRRRIAAGSGVPVSEVNDLLDRFDMMRKMMGQFSKMGGKGGGMPAPGSMPQRPAMHPNPMALKLQQFGRRRR